MGHVVSGDRTPILPPSSWHWVCHWPGCGLDTRGAGPFCYGHYAKLTPEQRKAATAVMHAYRADLVLAVTGAAEAIRAAHSDRFRELARSVAPSPVKLARQRLAEAPKRASGEDAP